MSEQHKHIVSIDQGTTSTRAIVFDHEARIVASGQREHEQIFPRPGYVEHDALEIWRNTREVIGTALADADITRHDVAAIGITNQRETVVVWDRATGKPIHNAIVWQDTRTQGAVDELAADGGVDRFADVTGLPLNAYFSASKLAWILDSVDGARERAKAGELLFGTIDTWLVWNLSGGTHGGVHITDVTNASRTLLMDLSTLDWSDELLEAFRIPRGILPEIRSSSEVYAKASSNSLLRETPIAGILGRSAGGDLRPGRLRPRRVQELLRDGQLRPVQHRSGARQRPAHAVAQSSATTPRSTRLRARSRSRDRSCSGCATISD